MKIGRTNLVGLPFVVTLSGVIIFSWITKAVSPTGSPWQIESHSAEFIPALARETAISLRRNAREEAEEVFFIIRGDDLVFYEDDSLKRINIPTNAVQWEHKVKQPSAITNNEWYVYTAHTESTAQYNEDNSLMFPGSIWVEAYDIETGEIIWSSSYKGVTYISHMAANANEIGISGHNGYGAYRDEINIAAGTGMTWGKKFDGLGVPRQFFIYVSGKMIYYDYLVESSDEEFIIAFGNKVYALDLSSDSIVWKKNIAAVTNLAVANNAVFILDQDAVLWTLDIQTGMPLGRAQFEPVNPEKPEPLANYGVPRYSVLASDGLVVVHFQEAQQLFAFRFPNKE